MDLVVSVYLLVKELPCEEKYELSAQIRRAAVSIPSNIAEGFGRNSPKAFLHFLHIAYGSAAELETQLIMAQRLDFLTLEQIEPVSKEILSIQKMIYSLTKRINEKLYNSE